MYKILKYTGDVDGAVATDGTLAWIREMNRTVVNEWRPYYTNEAIGVKKEFAGYIEEYEGEFTLGTVHGAGHMVP